MGILCTRRVHGVTSLIKGLKHVCRGAQAVRGELWDHNVRATQGRRLCASRSGGCVCSAADSVFACMPHALAEPLAKCRTGALLVWCGVGFRASVQADLLPCMGGDQALLGDGGHAPVRARRRLQQQAQILKSTLKGAFI